jgi:hypothetical protein
MRLYAPTSNAQLRSSVVEAARSNGLLDQTTMEASVAGNGVPAARWQAQSYAMVLYIADQIGLEGLFALARAALEAPFESVYREAIGQPLSTLVPNLRDWLFTPRGESAYLLSLYGAATATPAPTVTFTPFPPTRTPRPEPSVTPTPTITLTPTTRPTATRTPTVTPRPPGSLDTATPISIITPTNQPLIGTGSRTSILAVLVIVLAVLVILYARVGRR